MLCTHTLCTQMIQWAICPFIPLSFVLQKTDWRQAFFFHTAPQPTIHLRRPKQSNCICGVWMDFSLSLSLLAFQGLFRGNWSKEKPADFVHISFGRIETWVQSLVSLRSTQNGILFDVFSLGKMKISTRAVSHIFHANMLIYLRCNKSALLSGCLQICIFLQSASQLSTLLSSFSSKAVNKPSNHGMNKNMTTLRLRIHLL